MEKRAAIHDRFYKMSVNFLEVMQDLLQHTLPAAVLEEVDLEQLTLCSPDFLGVDLNEKFSDVVYCYRSAKGPAYYVYFVAEHQHRALRTMPRRFLEYLTVILKQHEKQYPEAVGIPTVIPLLFYQGQENYTPYPDRWHVVNLLTSPHLSLRFWYLNYVLQDLNRLADVKICKFGLSSFYCFIHKHALNPNFNDLLPQLKRIIMQVNDLITESQLEYLDEYIMNGIYYLLLLGKIADVDGFKRWVGALPRIGGKVMNSYSTNFIADLENIIKEEGREEGFVEGQVVTRGKEKLEIALELLKRGFSKELIAEVTRLSLNEIDKLLVGYGR